MNKFIFIFIFSVVVFPIVSASPTLIEYGPGWEKYLIDDDHYQIVFSGGIINLKNESGQYEPFTTVTSLEQQGTGANWYLNYSWYDYNTNRDYSVLLDPYMIINNQWKDNVPPNGNFGVTNNIENKKNRWKFSNGITHNQNLDEFGYRLIPSRDVSCFNSTNYSFNCNNNIIDFSDILETTISNVYTNTTAIAVNNFIGNYTYLDPSISFSEVNTSIMEDTKVCLGCGGLCGSNYGGSTELEIAKQVFGNCTGYLLINISQITNLGEPNISNAILNLTVTSGSGGGDIIVGNITNNYWEEMTVTADYVNNSNNNMLIYNEIDNNPGSGVAGDKHLFNLTEFIQSAVVNNNSIISLKILEDGSVNSQKYASKESETPGWRPNLIVTFNNYVTLTTPSIIGAYRTVLSDISSLNCSTVITNNQGGTYDLNFKWYLNNVEQRAFVSKISGLVNNGTFYSPINITNHTKYDRWTCSANVYDTTNSFNSTFKNSTATDINILDLESSDFFISGRLTNETFYQNQFYTGHDIGLGTSPSWAVIKADTSLLNNYTVENSELYLTIQEIIGSCGYLRIYGSENQTWNVSIQNQTSVQLNLTYGELNGTWVLSTACSSYNTSYVMIFNTTNFTNKEIAGGKTNVTYILNYTGTGELNTRIQWYSNLITNSSGPRMNLTFREGTPADALPIVNTAYTVVSPPRWNQSLTITANITDDIKLLYGNLTLFYSNGSIVSGYNATANISSINTLHNFTALSPTVGGSYNANITGYDSIGQTSSVFTLRFNITTVDPNSKITNSNLTELGLINRTTINNSKIDNSTILNSTITQTTIYNITVNNADIIGDQLLTGIITYDGQNFSGPLNISRDVYGNRNPYLREFFAVGTPTFLENITFIANLSVNNTPESSSNIRWVNISILSPNGNRIANLVNMTSMADGRYNFTYIINETGLWTANLSISDSDGDTVYPTAYYQVVSFNITDEVTYAPVEYARLLDPEGETLEFNLTVYTNSDTDLNFSVNVTGNLSTTYFNTTINVTALMVYGSNSGTNPANVRVTIQSMSSIPDATYPGNITLTRLYDNRTFQVNLSIGVNPPAGEITLKNKYNNETCNILTRNCDLARNVGPGDAGSIKWYINNSGGFSLTNCNTFLRDTIGNKINLFDGFTLSNISTFSIGLNQTREIVLEYASLGGGSYNARLDVECQGTAFGFIESLFSHPEQVPLIDITVVSPVGVGGSGGSGFYVAAKPIIPLITPAPKCGDGTCGADENWLNCPKLKGGDCAFDIVAFFKKSLFIQIVLFTLVGLLIYLFYTQPER